MITDKVEHGLIPVYERLLKKYKPQSLLEIGVFEGGSLDYFGEKVKRVVGVDIMAQPKEFKDNIEFYQINATHKQVAELGEFDFIIDDGSHIDKDIEATFNLLWDKCKMVYIIEDWATNLVGMNGYGKPEIFIEKLKNKYKNEVYHDNIKSYAIFYKS